jgi:hypothetical protein
MMKDLAGGRGLLTAKSGLYFCLNFRLSFRLHPVSCLKISSHKKDMIFHPQQALGRNKKDFRI